jgi:hypothetical protein
MNLTGLFKNTTHLVGSIHLTSYKQTLPAGCTRCVRSNFIRIKVLGIVCFLVFVGGMISCKPGKTGSNRIVVAKALNKTLYLDEIRHIFPAKVSKADSISLAQTYIQSWIKTQLILDKAELNLSPEQLDISEQIENYRSSLLIYKYEDQMVKDKLDTVVKDEEISTYYNDNANNFVLEENLVKVVYLKVPKNAPSIDKVKKWYKSDVGEDVRKLEEYAYTYATKYDYFNNNWVSFGLIKAQLPKSIDNEDEFIKTNSTIEQEDDNFYYFVYIREKNTKGSVSPFIFVKSKIKDIILNKRKVKFLNDLENNIYTDAQDHGNFEIVNLEKK